MLFIGLFACVVATETTSLSKFVESAVQSLNDAGNAQLASFGDYNAQNSVSEVKSEQPTNLEFIQSEQAQATSVADEMEPYRRLLAQDKQMDANSNEQPQWNVPEARSKPETQGPTGIFTMYRQRLQQLTAPAAPRPTIYDAAVPVGEVPGPVGPTYMESPDQAAAPSPMTPPQFQNAGWSQPSIAQGMTEQPVPIQPMQPLQQSSSPLNNPKLFSLYEQKLQSHGTTTVQLPLLQRYKAEVQRLSALPPPQ